MLFSEDSSEVQVRWLLTVWLLFAPCSSVLELKVMDSISLNLILLWDAPSFSSFLFEIEFFFSRMDDCHSWGFIQTWVWFSGLVRAFMSLYCHVHWTQLWFPCSFNLQERWRPGLKEYFEKVQCTREIGSPEGCWSCVHTRYVKTWAWTYSWRKWCCTVPWVPQPFAVPRIFHLQLPLHSSSVTFQESF